jgi:predicted acylesterase/phospholipase RssA
LGEGLKLTDAIKRFNNPRPLFRFTTIFITTTIACRWRSELSGRADFHYFKEMPMNPTTRRGHSVFTPRQAGFLFITIIYVLLIVSCGTVPTRNPLPEELGNQARIPGIPKARTWGDASPPWMDKFFALSEEELKATYPGVYGTEHNYLAISGGGENGAFSAGFLQGWSETGTRPEFTAITGVSTGALISPFAFLGSDHDSTLKEIYTGVSTKDIFIKRNLLVGLTSDALADTDPLFKLIQKYVTPEIREALAAEARRGRLLNVATTNLDAGRPVIWNLTRIAASEHPHALELIHKILLASASIPVAFPPVFIDVEANGQQYDEIHVDGGGASQVFLYPLGIDWQRVMKKVDVQGTPNVYLLRNARLNPMWQTVEPKLTKIANRTIGSLIRTQGIGDMYRVYLGAKRDGMDYHLAYIPDDFKEEPNEPFDREYMTNLYNLGYRLAKEGGAWRKSPPGAEVE